MVIVVKVLDVCLSGGRTLSFCTNTRVVFAGEGQSLSIVT